jgi:hypothetical protein
MSTTGSIATEHLKSQRIEKGGKGAHGGASRRDTGAEQQKYQEQRDHILLVFLCRTCHAYYRRVAGARLRITRSVTLR